MCQACKAGKKLGIKVQAVENISTDLKLIVQDLQLGASMLQMLNAMNLQKLSEGKVSREEFESVNVKFQRVHRGLVSAEAILNPENSEVV